MKTSVVAAATAGFIAAGLSFAAQSAEPGCVKEVFHKYCLGGSAQSLLAKNNPVRGPEKEVVTRYVFADGAEQTTVTIVQDRVESVTRRYAGSQSTFDQMSRDLRGIYGEPKRTAAPEKGKAGRIVELWDRGDWRMHLVWDGIKNTTLIYRHEGLQAARKTEGTYNPSTNPKGF